MRVTDYGADKFNRHGGQGGSFESCTNGLEGLLLAETNKFIADESIVKGDFFRSFAWHVGTTLQIKHKMNFTGLLTSLLMESEVVAEAMPFFFRGCVLVENGP